MIHVVESLKGYPGNDRLNYDDLHSLSVSLTQRPGYDNASIAMNEVQELECVGGDGNFTLTILNQSVSVFGAYSAAQLETALSSFDSNYSIFVTAVGDTQTICEPDGGYILLNYSMPWAEALPLMRAVNIVGNVSSVIIKPVTISVSAAYANDSNLGLYTIEYTPLYAGMYDIYVRINDIDVATDLVAGVSVVPTIAYAATR